MCDICGEDCHYDEINFYTELTETGKKMAKKDYVVEGGSYFDTLDEAVSYASKRVNKTMEDHRIYKVIKNVSTTTPNVIVTDLLV